MGEKKHAGGDDEEGKGFSLSLTPAFTALVKDALQPSFKLIGVELKDRLKDHLEKARAARRGMNLESHIRAVRDSLPSPLQGEDSYEQLELFHEWTEGAQDVDETQTELARIWRDLLAQIVTGKLRDRILIDTLKQVDAPMATILLGLNEPARKPTRGRGFVRAMSPVPTYLLRPPYDGKERFYRNRLVSLGLIRVSTTAITTVSIVVLFGVVALWHWVTLLLSMNEFGRVHSARTFYAYGWEASVAALAVLSLTFAVCSGLLISRLLRYPPHKVTWLGKRLSRAAKIRERHS